MDYNANLSELLGAIAGDGNLNVYKSKKRTDYKINICGHKEDDFDYLKHLQNLFMSIFNKEIKLKDKKRYICLELSNKEILNILNKAGIPIGNKSKIIEMPEKIKNNKELAKHFLRGLADTEFSVMFKKAGRKKYSYPRISVDLSSKKLIMQVSELLKSIDITHTIYKRNRKRNNIPYINYSININGKENLKKWMENIGFSNKKHLTKIEIWQKFGYCNPNSSLKEREIVLNMN